MDRHESYTALLRRHRHLVWTLCWARAQGDVERCRDLVQEVSLSLWEHFGKLRLDASPFEERAWVTWHTRTVLNHLHRRPKPVLVPLTDRMAAHLPAPDDGNPLDALMETLSPVDQQLVQLRLEGYDAAAIATQLNIKRDTVYQRLHRIIERLRKQNEKKQ